MVIFSPRVIDLLGGRVVTVRATWVSPGVPSLSLRGASPRRARRKKKGTDNGSYRSLRHAVTMTFSFPGGLGAARGEARLGKEGAALRGSMNLRHANPQLGTFTAC